MTVPCTQEERLERMASDIRTLRDAIGSPPNRATGANGTGMIGSITEVLVWIEEERESRAESASHPIVRLRTLQTWVSALAILIASGTVLGAMASAIIWLARRVP